MATDTSVTSRVRVATTGSVGTLRGELGTWLGPRGLLHLVFWSVGVNGLLYDGVVYGGTEFGSLGYESLMILLTVAVPVAGIILAEAMFVGEYRSGVMSWQVSKPVPRSGYVLAKVAGLWIGLSVTAILVPTLIANWWLPRVEPHVFVTPQAPAWGRLFLAMGLIALVLLFFITLTALLAMAIRVRGVVAMVPLIILFMMFALPVDSLYAVTPAGLMSSLVDGWSAMTKVVYGEAFTAGASLAWTAALAVAFLLGAMLLASRLEL